MLEHPHVKAVFGRKSLVKIDPQNGGFLKFKGLNRKYSHLDPQKALPYGNDVIWRILRKYPFGGVGCRLTEEPKKRTKKLVTPEALGSRNPLTDWYKIVLAGCRPRRNHACKFWWKRVKGFWHVEGSNFGPFHGLHLSFNTLALPCECVIPILALYKLFFIHLYSPTLAAKNRKICTLHIQHKT